MKIDEQLASEVAQLTPEHMKYMTELVFLMRFCPEFNAELDQIIPDGCEEASGEQLTKVTALTDRWLHENGWADIIRRKLEAHR